MDDETNQLVLETARAIRADLADMKIDANEIRTLLGSLELHYVAISRQVDRIDSDIRSIKKCLVIALPVVSFRS